MEPNPLTSINDAGALSHCIRDIGLKPPPELFVYFLGLEQETRLSKTVFPSKMKKPWQHGFRESQKPWDLSQNTRALISLGPGMDVLEQITLLWA